MRAMRARELVSGSGQENKPKIDGNASSIEKKKKRMVSLTSIGVGD